VKQELTDVDHDARQQTAQKNPAPVDLAHAFLLLERSVLGTPRKVSGSGFAGRILYLGIPARPKFSDFALTP
jgi:hypothetical protein